MPPRYREQMSTWRRVNPTWMHHMWDESSLRELLGGDRWWDVYASQDEPMARADVARYALLQRFGGVYADADTMCVRPIDALLSHPTARLFLTNYSHPRPAPSRYADATNSILASIAAHPFWDRVLARIEERNDPRFIVLARTGPNMLRELVAEHAAREPGDVHLIRFPEALTTALVPTPLMGAFGRLVRRNRILDFNDSGRGAIRDGIRAAWRIVTLRG